MHQPIKTPCVKVCVVDGQSGNCLGCGRTLGEIARWARFSDDERDIVAGVAAGMFTVAVTYGYLGQQADTAKWGADATINCVNELLPLLQLAGEA